MQKFLDISRQRSKLYSTCWFGRQFAVTVPMLLRLPAVTVTIICSSRLCFTDLFKFHAFSDFHAISCPSRLYWLNSSSLRRSFWNNTFLFLQNYVLCFTCLPQVFKFLYHALCRADQIFAPLPWTRFLRSWYERQITSFYEIWSFISVIIAATVFCPAVVYLFTFETARLKRLIITVVSVISRVSRSVVT